MSKTTRIELHHVNKIEGHGSLVATLNQGDFATARFSTNEGSRLIEGILLNRFYTDAPLITSRICGVCPIIHNLCSITAMEDALKVRVNRPIVLLRRVMLSAQFIHSHSLHAYLMSLPDYFAVPGAQELSERLPQAAQQALALREFGNRLIAIIGGRSVHPINSQVGGFLRAPDTSALKAQFNKLSQLIEAALALNKVMADIPYPEFERETEYLGLTNPKDYPFYDGTITSSWVGKLTPKEFLKKVTEEQLSGQLVKRTRYAGKVYLVGALARLNLNSKKLARRTKQAFHATGQKIPINNSFRNIYAQSLEIVQALELIERDLGEYLKLTAPKLSVPVRLQAGTGYSAMEAPRGTLFHTYKLDRYGRIQGVNIITPTAQFINNLEADVVRYLGKKPAFTPRDHKHITMLVRAYDPCMTCATH
jgi:coenzyme F420-reducing hydrogenase alpha subunit